MDCQLCLLLLCLATRLFFGLLLFLLDVRGIRQATLDIIVNGVERRRINAVDVDLDFVWVGLGCIYAHITNSMRRITCWSIAIENSHLIYACLAALIQYLDNLTKLF